MTRNVLTRLLQSVHEAGLKNLKHAAEKQNKLCSDPISPISQKLLDLEF